MTVLSCRRTGVPPVSDLDACFRHQCTSVTAFAACVLDCASPLALSFRYSNAVSAIFNLFASSLLKVIKGYSGLLKYFLKKYFFAAGFCQAWPATHGVGHPAGKGSPKKVKVGKCRAFSKIIDCLIPFPVLPSDLRLLNSGCILVASGRLRKTPGGTHEH
jgi:hypothetical protein